MERFNTEAAICLGESWTRRRLAILLDDYRRLRADDRARQLAGRQIRDFIRINPELIDAIPEDLWSGIYFVRARGTTPPNP